MRVLLQHPHAPGEISGVVTYCERLAAALRRQGVEVMVFSTHGVSGRALWRAVEQVDVVHVNSHHLWLVLFARLRGKRVVLKYHYPYWDSVLQGPFVARGFGGRCAEELRFLVRLTSGQGAGGIKHVVVRFARVVMRVALAFAVHRRLACSEFIARSCELPLDVAVDYYPMDLLSEVAPCPRVEPTRPRFVFAGRLEQRKGGEVLLRAIAHLRKSAADFELVIIGDGPERERLEQIVESENLRDMVIFHGKLERAAVLAAMAQATAVVVPSRDNDALPFVVIEAAALSRCVVGSSSGGIPELLGPDGLLFAPDDHEGLAGHLRTLLQRLSETEARGRALHRRVSALCDPAVAARRALEFYTAS